MTEYWDKYGRSPDKKTLLAIGLPSAGKDKRSYTFTETQFSNYCPKCKRKGTLLWGIFYGSRFNGKSEGGSAEGHIFCSNGMCDADYSVQGWDHINGSNYRCKILVDTKKSSKERALQLKEGKLPYDGPASSNSNDDNNSGSSIKAAIKDVMYNWDGEAELFLIDDTVFVRKIPSPTTAKLSLVEGVNVDLGSVTINDINPSTVNHLTAEFGDYELTIQDDYLIKRFGDIPQNVTIDKSIKKLDDAKEFLEREWNKIKRDNGHSVELKTYGHSNWRSGWCRVFLPSFNLDEYMYISRISQDDDGEWGCSLTLVDYPPGFGEPTSKNDDKNSNQEEETTETTTESEETGETA